MLANNKKDFKYWAIEALPWVFSLAYLAVCIYYYKERVTYCDNSYYLTKIFRKESFNIESGRAISVFFQIIPILLIKFSAPLRIVMVGYSVNFALIYIGCFFIIKYVFKSNYLAWGALLCTHLFLHYGFYFPTEMIVSAAIIVLIVAFLTINERRKDKPLIPIFYYGVGSLLLLLIVIIHPLYFIIMGAILFCLYLIDYNKAYLHFIAICIVFLFVKMVFFKSGYEDEKMGGISLSYLNFRSISHSILTNYWKQSFLERYFIAKYALFAFVLYLAWERKWLLALAIPFAYLSLYLLVYTSMPNGASLGYMDNYMVAISVFPLIVFLFYLEQKTTNIKNIFVVVSFLVSINGLLRVSNEPIFKDRVIYLESILAHGRTNNINKFFIEDSTFRHSDISMDWAIPYETLLISTLGGKTQTIFDNTGKYKLEEVNNPKLFLGAPWESPINNGELNKKYFQLDTGKYVRINGMDF